MGSLGRLRQLGVQLEVQSPARPPRLCPAGSSVSIGGDVGPRVAAATPCLSLTEEQKYEFDLRGFIVLQNHYDNATVEKLNRGIDELQQIPCEHAEYTRLGVASDALARAMTDPNHESWAQKRAAMERGEPPRRLDMGICGTSLWDVMVRDQKLNAIHHELAGGACNVSATYFIEKHGPVAGGGLHNGGFPKDKNIHYG